MAATSTKPADLDEAVEATVAAARRGESGSQKGGPAAPGSRLADAFEAVERFEPEAIEAALAPVLDRFELKPGRLYQPIRVAITGSSVSPGIFESLAALGRDDTLARIDAALVRLRSEKVDV